MGGYNSAPPPLGVALEDAMGEGKIDEGVQDQEVSAEDVEAVA